MTVVAYRGGVMACDSRWTHKSFVVTNVCKIRRLKSGALFGSAGEFDDRSIIELLQNVERESDLPGWGDLKDLGQQVSALLVLPDGSIYVIECNPDADEYCVYQPSEGYAAIGCGMRQAIPAMDAGASAIRACEIACARNVWCGGEIHSLKLKE